MAVDRILWLTESYVVPFTKAKQGLVTCYVIPVILDLKNSHNFSQLFVSNKMVMNESSHSFKRKKRRKISLFTKKLTTLACSACPDIGLLYS